MLCPGNFSKAVSWSNCKTHFVSHPLGDTASLPDAHVLKTVVIYLCGYFLGVLFYFIVVVSGIRVNLDLLFHLGQIRSLLEKYLTFYFKKIF